MKKIIAYQLLTKLKKSAPDLPIRKFEKIKRASIKELFKLAPLCPYKVVEGVRLLDRLEKPSIPIK